MVHSGRIHDIMTLFKAGSVRMDICHECVAFMIEYKSFKATFIQKEIGR